MNGILTAVDLSEVLDNITELSSTVIVPVVIKGAVLMAIVGAITMAMKRSTPAMRYRVWFTGLLGLLLLPLAIAIVPAWKVYVLPPTVADVLVPMPDASPSAVTIVGAGGSEIRVTSGVLSIRSGDATSKRLSIVSSGPQNSTVLAIPLPDVPVAIDEPVVPLDEATGRGLIAVAIETIAAAARSVEWRSMPWTLWFVIAWTTGSIILLFRLVAAHIGVASLVRRSRRVDEDDWQLLLEEAAQQMGVKQRVFLRWSDIAIVPLNAGIIKSIILLPESAEEWSVERRRAVLLHELAHVQRRDCLTHFVSQITNAVYWINPFTWRALEMMMTERERAADDSVLAVGTKASAYAQTLLETAQNYNSADWSTPATLAMARKSQLENRMLAILDPTRRPGQTSRANRVLTSFIVMMIALPLAAFTPSSMQEAQVAKDSSKTVSPPQSPLPPRVSLPTSTSPRRVSAPNAAVTIGRVTSPIDFDYPDVDFDYPDVDFDFPDIDVDVAEVYDGIMDGFADAKANLAWAPVSLGFGKFSELDLARNLEFESRQTEFETNGRLLVVGDSLSIEQIIRLRRFGVDGEFIRGIKALGFSSPTYEDLISLARHDANAEYIAAMRTAGFRDLTLSDYARAARYDVTASFAQEMRGSGLGTLTLEDLIKLARYDVTLENIKGLKNAGVQVSSVDDVARLNKYDVTPEIVQELQKLGYTQLSVDDLVSFSRYDATTDYVSALRSAGYTGLTLKEIGSLSRYDVSPELIAALSSAGYKNLSVEELGGMGRYGVSAAFIKDMSASGYAKLSAEDLTSLARYDVDSEYVAGLRSAGYESLSVKDIRNMKRHNVDLDFIREIQNAGIKSPTPEQLIDMRRHGVDGGFIKSLKSN